MSEEVFKRSLPDHCLDRSKLRTYTGERMRVLGQVLVDVRYQKQSPLKLILIVIKGAGPTLLGRDWLQHLCLHWSSINNELNGILNRFDDIFADGLGTIKQFQEKLAVDVSAKPRFHRPRPV